MLAEQSKKFGLSAICIILLVLSFFVVPHFFFGDPSDSTGYFTEHLDAQTQRALVSFTIAKSVNALISVVQSIDFEASAVVVSVGVNPFEFLDPVNDLIESISNGILLALGALVLQKTLLYLNGWLVFKTLLPVSMGCFILSLWTSPAAAKRLSQAGLKCLVSAAVISIFIPASIQLSIFIEDGILDKTVNESISTLIEDSKTIEVIGGEIAMLQGETPGTPEQESPTGPPDTPPADDAAPRNMPDELTQAPSQQSWWGRTMDTLTNRVKTASRAMSIDEMKAKFTSMAEQLRIKANDMALNFLKLLSVFAINTVLLPLLTLWALWQILRWMLRPAAS